MRFAAAELEDSSDRLLTTKAQVSSETFQRKTCTLSLKDAKSEDWSGLLSRQRQQLSISQAEQRTCV